MCNLRCWCLDYYFIYAMQLTSKNIWYLLNSVCLGLYKLELIALADNIPI
jgi:hypothetical protein